MPERIDTPPHSNGLGTLSPGADYALTDGFPALLTLVLIPLTCSITNGIGVGVIVYVLLSVLGGRARAVPGLLWLLAAAFVLYFLLLLV